MGQPKQTGLKRRRLRTPAARARARQLAALRQWIRQRGAVIAVVLMLLAPFGLMAAVTGSRIALGAPPMSTPSRSSFSYTENAVVIIDPGVTVVDDTPFPEVRQIYVDYTSSGPINKPTTQRLFVQPGGSITVTGQTTGTLHFFHGATEIASKPEGGGNNASALLITLNPSVLVTVTDVMLQDLMRAIAYEDVTDDPIPPTGAGRQIFMMILDPSSTSGPQMDYDITPITQVNDGPTITSPPETLNVEDDTDLNINTPAASTPVILGDLDSGGNPIAMTLSVPNGQGVLTMTGGGCSIGGSGTASLTLSATESAADTCLSTLTYRSPPNFSGTVTLTIDASDNGYSLGGLQVIGQTLTAQSTITISVSSVNAAPVLTVPSGQSVLQYQPLSIPAIGYADADALSGIVSATLTVTKGTLSIGNQVGLSTISGNGTATVTMTGLRSVIDGALDTITYTSTASTGNLDDVLTVVADDQGNTGSGGAKTDTETIAITVSEFNDAPTITSPVSAGVTEDVSTAVAGISISDPDANPTTDLMLMSMSVTQGTMTLGNITGLIFGIGDGTADGTMQFQGTINDINTALGTLTYLTASNASANATLTLDLNDQGFTGSPGAQSAPQKLVTLTISGVNDAPAITVPGAQGTPEDTAVTFAGGTLISVADPDAGSSPIQVALSVSHGTLTLSGTSGLSFPSGANGTAAMTISGTVTDINAALNGMIYQPTLNYLGSDTLSVSANDLGNTGSGPAGTDNESVTINISAVNDAPVVSAPASINVTEDVPFTVSGVGVSDVDAGSATIHMTFSATTGRVGLNDTTGLTQVSGANGTSTVTFSGTITAFNNVLNTLLYVTNLNSTTADTLVITADDQGNTGAGGAQTHSVNVSITVGAVNDGPTITVPAPSYSIGEELALTINGTGIQVADPDVGGLNIEVTITASHGTLTLSGTSGLSFSIGDGTSDTTMTFSGTLANVNAALGSVVYQGVTDYIGPDTINLSATDLGNSGSGGPLTDTDSISITVGPVNDPPVIAVPPSATVTEDVSTAITGISVSDSDAGSASIQMSFSVGAGAITFGNTAGLTLASGSNGSSAVSYSGTISNLNAALTTLTYLTALNANASDALTVVANDLGNTGVGGAQSDTEIVTINISPVNDAPNITIPVGTQNGAEDTALPIAGLSISDVDAGSSQVRVTLTAGFGTLTISPTGSLSFDVGDGTSDQTMTFRGTVANINTALANLQYHGLLHFNGSDAILVTVDDQGNTGSGGSKTDSDTIPVFLVGMNDPPVLVLPSPQSATEDVNTPITGVSVSDADVGSTQIKITLSVTSGTLTLGATTGLTFDPGSDGVSDASMAFTGSMTNVNNALASIIYRGSQDFDATDTLTVNANDLGNNGSPGPQSTSGTITINVAGQNDGPEISLPPTQNPSEDTDHVINGVGVTISDVDVGGGQIQVQLTVSNGVLTLSTTAGLTFDVGDGTQDATMTFRGTLSQVNAALHNMIYRGNSNFTGSDPLTIVAGDLGNTGAGGPRMDSDVLQILVGDINDAPVVTVPGGQAVNEDTNLSIMGIGVADTDIGSSLMRITMSVVNGTLSLGSTSGLSFTAGDGASDATMTFTGSIGDVNGALAAIQYRGNQDFNGTDTITIVANDQGATGAGGAQQDTETITVNVGAINDAPVVTLPGPVQTVNSASPVMVDSQATVGDVDSTNFDGGTLTVTIVNNATSSDRIDFRNSGSGSGQVGVSVNTLSVNGTAIGTYSGETSQGVPLVVNLNANATPNTVQMLVRNLTFRVVDAEPAPSTRTIRFVLSDGDGNTSNPADKQVRVAPSADLALKYENVPSTIGGLTEFDITIVVTNNGPLTATGVVVTTPLPDELSFKSATTNKGSCDGGRTITCQLGSVRTSDTVRIVLRVYNTSVNTYEVTSTVTGTSDDQTAANNTARATVWAAGENPPGDEKDKEDDRKRKLTEERRQQTQRTNQHGLDDYRTEGNVTEVNFIVDQPFAIVMMRDGPQKIILPCKGGCPDVRVGDYLEADGVKENEQLFYAEDISLTRGGKKVKGG